MDLSDVRGFLATERFQPTLAFSSDGERIAYVGNTGGQFNLWVRLLDPAIPPRQLTAYTDRTVRRVAWAPGGSTLAFTLDHRGDEQHQIRLIDADGGAVRPVTTAADRQFQLAESPFSADGRFLLYGGNDRDRGTHDTIVRELKSGQIRRVASEPGLRLQPSSISPDGRWLLACGEWSNTRSDCYLVDLADLGSSPIAVTADDGPAGHWPGPWAADSASFLLLTDRGREFQALASFSLESRKIELVAAPPWDVEAVVSSADGRVLAWTVNEDGRSVPQVWRDGVPVRLPEVPPGVLGSLTLSPDGRTLAFLLDTAARPTELVVLDLAIPGLRWLSDSRPAAARVLDAREPRLVDYPAPDGLRIPGYLYRPERTGGRSPVVVSVHGGPEAQARLMYSPVYQCLLAQGIGVFAPNIRGSSGYGNSYQRLIHHDWGGAELGDLEYAAGYLRGVDWIDGGRIGVFGMSFGGFAALSCLSRQPALWAVGVSIVGPSNLVTLTRSVPKTWLPVVAEEIGDPETETEFLLSRSPITYADRIAAPLFVIQGANDPRVTRVEGDQIVERALANGAPVRYDVYENEGHGFTRRENEIKALSDIVSFLVEHLCRAAVPRSTSWRSTLPTI
jgi:dipeptidyl aminopeptidase/acylaminoacyl peptidase